MKVVKNVLAFSFGLKSLKMSGSFAILFSIRFVSFLHIHFALQHTSLAYFSVLRPLIPLIPNIYVCFFSIFQLAEKREHKTDRVKV